MASDCKTLFLTFTFNSLKCKRACTAELSIYGWGWSGWHNKASLSEGQTRPVCVSEQWGEDCLCDCCIHSLCREWKTCSHHSLTALHTHRHRQKGTQRWRIRPESRWKDRFNAFCLQLLGFQSSHRKDFMFVLFFSSICLVDMPQINVAQIFPHVYHIFEFEQQNLH